MVVCRSLSPSWNSATWDDKLNITFPPNRKSSVPYTNQGRATVDAGCKNLRLYWSDDSVWCQGKKIGGTDCGGHATGPPPPPHPHPHPHPPPAPPAPPAPPMHVELHLIEHTHDDVGWNLNIPQYYTNGTHGTNNVRNILNVATSGLAANPARKFIYVEVAFFQLWWKEQNATWRARTRKLVESGQLEFINAGWCMSDEAASHFVDQVDQMTIGHLWLQAQFGRETVQPTVR